MDVLWKYRHVLINSVGINRSSMLDDTVAKVSANISRRKAQSPRTDILLGNVTLVT
jgi:hypothetical protein